MEIIPSCLGVVVINKLRNSFQQSVPCCIVYFCKYQTIICCLQYRNCRISLSLVSCTIEHIGSIDYCFLKRIPSFLGIIVIDKSANGRQQSIPFCVIDLLRRNQSVICSLQSSNHIVDLCLRSCIVYQCASIIKCFLIVCPRIDGVIFSVKILAFQCCDQRAQFRIIDFRNNRKILNVKYLHRRKRIYQFKFHGCAISGGKIMLKYLIDILSIQGIRIILIHESAQLDGRTCYIHSTSQHCNKLCECNEIALDGLYRIGIITKSQGNHHRSK